MEASLEKARQVNGRNLLRAMHLGPVGQITIERLYEASFTIERKLAAMRACCLSNKKPNLVSKEAGWAFFFSGFGGNRYGFNINTRDDRQASSKIEHASC